MERKTQTHLYCLKPGDRFYFQNDANKNVWEVVKHGCYYFKYFRKKATWCTYNGIEQRFNSERTIIFLGVAKQIPSIQTLF